MWGCGCAWLWKATVYQSEHKEFTLACLERFYANILLSYLNAVLRCNPGLPFNQCHHLIQVHRYPIHECFLWIHIEQPHWNIHKYTKHEETLKRHTSWSNLKRVFIMWQYVRSRSKYYGKVALLTMCWRCQDFMHVSLCTLYKPVRMIEYLGQHPQSI